MGLFSKLFQEDHTKRYYRGLWVEVVRCESCYYHRSYDHVCDLIGKKVQLGNYLWMRGQNKVKGGRKILRQDEWRKCEDQTPPPRKPWLSIFARWVGNRLTRAWKAASQRLFTQRIAAFAVEAECITTPGQLWPPTLPKFEYRYHLVQDGHLIRFINAAAEDFEYSLSPSMALHEMGWILAVANLGHGVCYTRWPKPTEGVEMVFYWRPLRKKLRLRYEAARRTTTPKTTPA